MRLSPTEHKAITEVIYDADGEAAIYLFGSRADGQAKGGDIDLLVLSRKIDLMKKLDILAQLHRQLGDQRIDLLVYPDISQPFARLARDSGVRL